MNSKGMKDVSKNDVLKTFKAMLHYGVKIYNFNFNQVLALMEKFKSPGERKKEQDFYVFKAGTASLDGGNALSTYMINNDIKNWYS